MRVGALSWEIMLILTLFRSPFWSFCRTPTCSRVRCCCPQMRIVSTQHCDSPVCGQCVETCAVNIHAKSGDKEFYERHCLPLREAL